MSIFFEHEGLTYELPDGTSPEVAKQKILTHLGKQNTPSFPKENSNQPGILEYLNPANMYDAIVAGAQKDLGNEEKYKERIKSLDTRLKTGVNQSIGDTAKGVGTGLIDLVGGVPAMLAGAIQGVGSTIANKSADVGYKAGEQTMHEFMPSTWLGLDTNNSTYQGMMAPVAPIMEGIDTAGTGYGEIARVSGANPTLQKNIAATVKGSLMGGLMAKGGIETYSKLNELKRKQNKENQPESAPVPVNKELLLKKAKADIESKFQDTTNELIKLQELKQKGTPEWDQASAKYLELKFQKEKLNKMLGVEEKPIATSLDPVEQRDILIRKANSGKELTEQEIALYDELSLAIEKQKKQSEPVSPVVPEEPSLKPTERPLEAVKPAEVIPEPVRATEKPVERPAIGNENWDRSLEWKSENVPDETSWKLAEQLKKDKEQTDYLDRTRINLLLDAARGNKRGSGIFGSKEELQHYAQLASDELTRKIRQIQDALNFAKQNGLSEVNIKDKRTVSVEKLKELREEYLRDLETLGKNANKSNLSIAEMENRLADPIIPNVDGSKYSADSISRRLKGLMRKYETTLDRLGKSLSDYEDGRIPSGSPVFKYRNKEYGYDAALQLQKDLTSTYETYKSRYEKAQNAKANVESFRERTPSDEGLPTLDASLLDEAKDTNVIEPKSIDEIMDASAHPVKDFMDNPDFFDIIDNSDTHIDKRLSEVAPNIAEAMDAFVKDLGFEGEKIYIVLDSAGKEEIRFQGNSAIITLNAERIAKYREALMNDPKTGPFVRKLSEPQFKSYLTAKILSHELGHIVLRKFLKIGNPSEAQFRGLLDSFNSFLKQRHIDPITFTTDRNIKAGAEYHKLFDEYFAERVSNALISDSLLNKFRDKRFKLNKEIQKIVQSAKDWLKSKNINIDLPGFKDDLIKDIINKNREAIKTGSENYWNELELQRNNEAMKRVGFKTTEEVNRPFANKTYQEIGSVTVDDLVGDPMKWSNETPGHSDIVNLSVDAANKLGNSIATNFFGKTTVSTIYNKYPLIKKTNFLIRAAERQAQIISNKLFFGDTSKDVWESQPFWKRFSKVKNPDSMYAVLQVISDREAYNIHEVLRQGREYNRELTDNQPFGTGHLDTLDYPEILDMFGSHLTEAEKKYYNIFAKMENDAHIAVTSIQKNLGKKNILPYSKGYFPVIRRGDYGVNIYFGDSLCYSEFFPTKAAAEAKKNSLKQNPELKGFNVSEVLTKEDSPYTGMLETGQIIKDYIDKKFPEIADDAIPAIDEVLDKMTKGTKLGKHHEFRTDLPGYKGSELLLTPEELGRNFKTAIQDHIKEYSSGIRNMIIRDKLDPVLYQSNLKSTNPLEYSVMEQMRASALNVVPNKFEAFDTAVHNFVDSIGKAITENVLHKEFKPEEPIFTSITHALTSTFYLFKVLPKLSMAVTQLLSPIQSIRHAAYQGGFRATKNFGKGLANFFTKDPELYDSLYRISQTTDTLEPQFINALHLQGKNKIFEFVKDWVLMRKPQEATDVLSRAITYSYMYTHYRDLGLSIKDAEKYALHGTDATMAAYSTAETAPIFKKTGTIIGENIRPLQTYGQSQFGALIADINHFKTKDPSTWAPLVIYGITSTMMGGAVSGAIISNYEVYRLILAKFGYVLPSALDMISQMPNFLEGVVEDPDTQTKLLAYGGLSALTGIDLGSSARTTDSFLTALVGILDGHTQYSRIMPTLGTAGLATSGGVTIGKKVLGGNVSDKDLRDAITNVAPVGPIGWGIKELAGVNETKVMGQPTGNVPVGANSEALMPKGTLEKIAAPLGNRSTQERFLMDKNLENTREEKIIQDRINNYLNLYNEKPDPKYIQELVSLGVEGKNLENALKIRMNRALLPQEIRFFTSGANNTVPNTMKSARRVNRIFNFGDK